MKWYHPLLKFFFGVAISINIFLLTFQFFALNENYYYAKFSELKVADVAGIDEADLKKVTHALVQSLESGSESLMVTAEIRGLKTVFFNNKEREHMDDVQVLFSAGKSFLWIVQVLMVISILILYHTSSKDIQFFIEPIKYALFAALLFLIFLASLYFIDFDWAFRKFHEIFFTNDLWLLDPTKDRLIMLMPLAFFIDFVKRWLIVSALLHAFLAGTYVTLKVFFSQSEESL